MPNWCMNRLVLTGPDEAIWELISESAGMPAATLRNLIADTGNDVARNALVVSMVDGSIGTFSFAGCVPMPEELRGTSSPSRASDEEQARLVALYGAADWYDWSVQNWGSKWDAADVEVGQVGTGAVAVAFDTAWSPPEPWAAAASARHPGLRLRLEYFEPALEAEGWVEFADGELLAEGEVVEWAQRMRAEWAEDHDAVSTLEDGHDTA